MADSRSGHPQPAGPYFSVDLHLHTNRGSSDSNLAPKDLVERARAIGIGAVCITEHDNMWDSREMAAMAGDSGVIFLRGMEVTTDMGHVGAFGLERYVGGIYKLAELRRVIDLEGGILIANHPFRYKLDPRFSFINPDSEPIDPTYPGPRRQAQNLRARRCDRSAQRRLRRGRERLRTKSRASSRDGRSRRLGLAFGRLSRMRNDAARRSNQGRARPDRRNPSASMPRRPRTIEERARPVRAVAIRQLNALKKSFEI